MLGVLVELGVFEIEVAAESASASAVFKDATEL
jgi:hypothetical protein